MTNTKRTGVDGFNSIDESDLASVGGGSGLAELRPLVSTALEITARGANTVRSFAESFFSNVRSRFGR